MELLFWPTPLHLRAMFDARWIIWVVFGFGMLLGASAETPPNSRFVQDRFAIGFWVDPPADKDMEARYAEIAGANFTFTLGAFGATTSEAISRQLAYCEKYGLKALVSMAGLPAERLPTNSACWGYFVTDEPGLDAFPGLQK